MKNWHIGSPEKNTVSKIMIQCGVTSLAASALAAKGYSSPESVISALNVGELSDPFLIADMQKAADTINNAVDSGEKICVFGDYDCDGIMASVILYSYLLEIGADVTYYIPERSEGYGLNNDAIDKICGGGVKLIITVDNGISAISEAEYIYSLGMKLIVTDHHRQGDALPKAEAVVDPHRHDDTSPFKFLCGAAVALKLVAALEGGDYTMAMEQFGDLAAIATIADVVSLTGENRFLAAYGLKLINNSDRPSIITLKEISGLSDKKIDSRSIGFGISPRINAAGRCGSPKMAMELLLCESPDEALRLAKELDSLNVLRKDMESEILTQIYETLDVSPDLLNQRVLCIFGKNWHHGIIGLVCSRITEQFGKPCFIASEENGEIRGSARSFGDFSVFGALTAAADTLSKFGGHPAAGGFTIKPGMQEDFRRAIAEYALANHSVMPAAELRADCRITPDMLTVENVSGLELLEPFGTENEKPLFLIEDAYIADISPLSGGIHSKLRLNIGNTAADALMFRTPPNQLPVRTGDRCDLIVALGINEFRNKTSVSIFVNDIHPKNLDQNKFFVGLNIFESFIRGEKLPDNYYPSMLPTRDMTAAVYKNIPENGISSDTLFLRLVSPQLNYCRFRVAVEAMRQLELISVSAADQVIRRNQISRRADLNSAPVLISLREKIQAALQK